jgi:hypothetical protein
MGLLGRLPPCVFFSRGLRSGLMKVLLFPEGRQLLTLGDREDIEWKEELISSGEVSWILLGGIKLRGGVVYYRNLRREVRPSSRSIWITDRFSQRTLTTTPSEEP